VKAVFVDIETTGLDFNKHVPLDIGVVVADLNDLSCVQAYTSCITAYPNDWVLADKEALEVNGFTKENHYQLTKNIDVVAQELEQFLVDNGVVKGKALFICQNPSFDRPFFVQIISQKRMNELRMPYHWLDLASMYWIKFYGCCTPIPTPDCIVIGLDYEVSLSKDSIARHLGLKEEAKPHKALNGAMHLMQCYMALSMGCYLKE
jgi:oligoribonuclease